MKNLKTLTFCFVGFLALTACTSKVADLASVGIFQRGDDNMLERNYAAADFLVGQAQTFIYKRSDVIQVFPLENAQNPDSFTEFAKYIPEQIGIRFAQIGYQVDLRNVSTVDDKAFMDPGQNIMRDPEFSLTGTYVRRRTDVDINLRITQLETGRVVGTFNYSLPYTREVAEMSQPQAQIMRKKNP